MMLNGNKIIGDIKELVAQGTERQAIYYQLIKGMVRLHQKYRIEKSYMVSDEIRDILSSVGVKIIQGTGGYEYDDIPVALKGRPVQDTWEFSDDQ